MAAREEQKGGSASASGDWFAECIDMKTKFPDLEDGIEIHEQIMQSPLVLKTNVTIPWFGEDGSKQVFPHADNVRGHAQILAKYVTWVKKFGLINGVRGSPWAIASNNSEGPYYLISWGSLARACYEAFASDPENPKVKLTRECGLRGVTIFHTKTPKYIRTWLRDWHNQWHSGQGQSLVERYQKIPVIDATFACLCKAKGWQARTCGKGEDSWRGRKWTFVQNHSPRWFTSMLSFENAASTIKFLKQKDWYESFVAFADACTMWDDTRLDNALAIDVIHKWLLELVKYDMTDEFRLITFLEGVRLMLPTVQVSQKLDGVKVFTSGRQVSLAFSKEDTSASNLLLWINAPMKDSAVYKEKEQESQNQSQGKRKATNSGGQNQNGSKRSRNGNGNGNGNANGGAAKAKAKTKSVEVDKLPDQINVMGEDADALWTAHDEEAVAAEVQQHQHASAPTAEAFAPEKLGALVKSVPHSREVQWMDDAYAACVSVLALHGLCQEDGTPVKQETKIEDGKVASVRQQLFSFFMSTALSFCWHKEVSIKGKSLTKWSQVRSALCGLIVEAAVAQGDGNGHGNMDVDGNSDGSANAKAASWADALVEACDDGDSKGEQTAEGRGNAASIDMTTAQKKALASKLLELYASKLEAFLAANNGKALRLQPCFNAAIQSVWSGLAAMKDSKPGMNALVEQMMLAIESTHSATMLSLAALLKDNAPASLSGAGVPRVLSDVEKTSVAARSRAAFFHILLKNLVDAAEDGDSGNPLVQPEFKDLLKKATALSRLLSSDKKVVSRVQDFDAEALLQTDLPHETQITLWQNLVHELIENERHFDNAVDCAAGKIRDALASHKGVAVGASDSQGSGDAEAGAGGRREGEDGGDGDGAASAVGSTKPSTMASLFDILTAFNEADVPKWDPVEMDSTDKVPTLEIERQHMCMSALQPVFAAIESKLYELAFMEDSMMTYKSLQVDITQRVPCVTTNVKKASELNWMPFAGKVTINRHMSDSYLLCVLSCGKAELPLYVTGDKHKTLSNDVIIPAFCCKPVPFGTSSLHLTYHDETIDLSHLDLPFDELEIQVPGLEWSADMGEEEEQEQEERWEITRPYAPPPKAKKGEPKAAAKKLASEMFVFKRGNARGGGSSSRAVNANAKMLRNVMHLMK